jgi:hypothetical protein
MFSAVFVAVGLGSAPAAVTPAPKEVFACNLRGLTEAQRVRHGELSKKLMGSAAEITELDDGFRFRLSADGLVEAAEWVSYEHKCCPFFTFALKQSRDEGPVLLDVTGSPGVKTFIRSEFRLPK